MQLSNLPGKIQVAFATGGGKNTIPVASQIGVTPGAASYNDGFPPLTRTPLVSGGVPPSGADMNGILYEISLVERWLCAGGQFKYDSAFSAAVGGYPRSAVLNSTNSDIQWISTADNNTTDPDSVSSANWAVLASHGIATISGLTGGTVATTAAQYGKPTIVLTGVLTSNLILTFPINQVRTTVVNNTTGAFTVTCKTPAGSGVVIEQAGQDEIFGDGTNIVPRIGNTAAKFDATAKLATMKALKQAGMQHSGPIVITATRTLTPEEAVGNFFVVSGTAGPINITVPALSVCPGGSAITVFNASGFTATLVRSASDAFNVGVIAPVTTYSIAPSDSITMSSLPGVSNWQIYDGSSRLQYTPGFAASKLANGYQRLPGGLIIQWGAVNIGNYPTIQIRQTVAFTFPIVFPTGILAVSNGLVGGHNGAVFCTSSIEVATASGANAVYSSGATSPGPIIQYVAIGH